ncbi:hypothetical protein [Enterobacter wuhouensis]|uniref:hypothetical protein n=1 Tax=Enterobacter wuhouensis TaxID=2529381 RepID=UPI002FDC99F2
MKDITEWDGEGLPPAGFECEARYRHTDKSKWFHFRCVSVDGGVAFGWAGGAAGQAATTLSGDGYEFRPTRSEEDEKRDAAISAIDATCLLVRDASNTAAAIYDAIAAGDIPGVKIE